MTVEELTVNVLRLPRLDRAKLAQELFLSLQESEDEVAVAWAGELERRSRELAEGKVQPIPWEVARLELLSELNQRYEARTSS